MCLVLSCNSFTLPIAPLHPFFLYNLSSKVNSAQWIQYPDTNCRSKGISLALDKFHVGNLSMAYALIRAIPCLQFFFLKNTGSHLGLYNSNNS